METKDVVGFIFPITTSMYGTLLKRKKAVFCKFMPFKKIPKYLKMNQKLFFYISGRLIGSSIIGKIKIITPRAILKYHSKDMLISSEEFKLYAGDRLNQEILVLFIKGIKMFKNKKKLAYPVTTSGRYITKNEYNTL